MTDAAFACWDPKCNAHEDNYPGTPDAPGDGEFVQRHDGNSNIHIAVRVEDDHKVRMACGQAWYMEALRHANGDAPRQCHACWEAM
jgi:hypothetical protein